jgi:hypothetical protein
VEPSIIAAIVSAAAAVVAALMVFRRSGQANDINGKANELGWVKELRQDALDTRKEMEALQQQVANLRRQLTLAQREAEHWVTEYQFLHRTIWRDTISVDRLRELVGPPPQEPPAPASSNGNRPNL